MTQKRPKISLPRRRFDTVGQVNQIQKPPQSQRPDIISIWEEQKRLREEEARLEREYQRAKAHLKDLKIQMKKKDQMLADVGDLQSTLRDDISRIWQTSGLWLAKSTRKIKLKSTVGYLKLRQSLGMPLVGRSSFRREKLTLATCVTIAAGALVIFINPVGSSTGDNSKAAVAGSTKAVASQLPLNQTPEFAVLSPGGQGVGNLGGFAKVSPEGTAPVYSFVDSIGKVKIRISQQQLPERFKNSTLELEKMAKDFNANRQLESPGLTAYIGQSIDGPQSLLFTKQGLLVLISSDQTIADLDWQKYLSELSI